MRNIQIRGREGREEKKQTGRRLGAMWKEGNRLTVRGEGLYLRIVRRAHLRVNA